jgi:predicted RNase H-like HicB family nuclease
MYSNIEVQLERHAVKFSVTLERDEDGIWVIECPSIPGCVSQGETREEALENIKEAIALCLEVRSEIGLPLTIETQQVEVVA